MNKIIYLLYHLLIVLIVIAITVIAINKYRQVWVAGRDGKHCYVGGNIPETVHIPVVFNTLKECEKHIKKK